MSELIIQVRLIERQSTGPKRKPYVIERTLDRRDIGPARDIGDGEAILDDAETWASRYFAGDYDPERDDFDHYVDTPPDYEGDPERDRDEERYNAQLLREE